MMPDPSVGQNETLIITDEMVRKALEVYYTGGPVGVRPTPQTRAKMRAALEVVADGIVEENYEDDEEEETSPRFTKGDIVEWTVMGSGGPGYVMGKIKCEVTHVSLGGTELVVRPLSWSDAWEVLEREYEFEDFLEDYKHGGLENVGADDCTLMRKSNIDVIDHGSHISIAFNVKEESRVLYRCVNNTLSRSLGLDNDRLVLEQIQSQLKEILTDVHPTTDS